MTSDKENDDDVARLHALLRKVLAAGDIPADLLEVTDEEVKALDQDRVAKLKDAVVAGDAATLRSLLEATNATSGHGFYRGSETEEKDAGLDDARRRLREKRRKERHGETEDSSEAK